MAAVIAQEIDIVELVEPIGVVDHHRVVGAVTETQELAKDRLDADDIGADLGIAQELARLVLA